MHIIGIVALVRITLDLVPYSERKHEFIERADYARDGHDAPRRSQAAITFNTSLDVREKEGVKGKCARHQRY